MLSDTVAAAIGLLQRDSGTIVTPFAESLVHRDTRSRFARLPFVLLLTFGLLVSLIHCAGCDVAFANSSAAVAVSSHTGAPDAPEQALPCHGGHCLSHANAQMAAAVTIPADHRRARLCSLSSNRPPRSQACLSSNHPAPKRSKRPWPVGMALRFRRSARARIHKQFGEVHGRTASVAGQM